MPGQARGDQGARVLRPERPWSGKGGLGQLELTQSLVSVSGSRIGCLGAFRRVSQ